jgi:hypothetical protein
VAVPLGKIACHDLVVTGACQLREGSDLSRPERPADWALAGCEQSRHRLTFGGRRDPPFEARPGPRNRKRPVEDHMARLGERVESSHESRPAIRRDHRPDRPRSTLQLDKEIGIRGREIDRWCIRAALGHEIESFEETGRQHCADDDCRRG